MPSRGDTLLDIKSASQMLGCNERFMRRLVQELWTTLEN